jgi:hypothetical protein
MALLRYFRRSTDPLREAEVAQTPASSMAVTSFVRLLLDRTANSPVLDDRLRGSHLHVTAGNILAALGAGMSWFFASKTGWPQTLQAG